MRRSTSIATIVFAAALLGGMLLKVSGVRAEDAKGVVTDLSKVDGFPITIQAPEGAEVKDDFGDASVKKGDKFQLQIHPQKTDIAKTKAEIVANTLNKLKRFIVESDDVLLYESAVAGQSEFHFIANVTVGDKTFSAEDNKGPTYSQADVEQMLAAFKTAAAKK